MGLARIAPGCPAASGGPSERRLQMVWGEGKRVLPVSLDLGTQDPGGIELFHEIERLVVNSKL